MKRLILAAMLGTGGVATADVLPVTRCINLGNVLDAPTEGEWGPRARRADIRWIAEQGFDTMRLPVRFHAHWHGRIDPAFLARVDEIIGWARDEGLKVIIDQHHFEPLMTDPATQAPIFQAIWEELSVHYAEMPDDLMFELLNEASESLDNARLGPLYADAIAAIRRHNPDRWIIAGGDHWNGVDAMLRLRLPADDRIALTFHYYEPFDFTHQLAPWTGLSLPARDWGTQEERRALAATFARAVTATRPVLLGEFGVYRAVPPLQRGNWTKAVRQQAEAEGFGWCVWAYDADFPVRDRASGDWIAYSRAALMGR